MNPVLSDRCDSSGTVQAVGDSVIDLVAKSRRILDAVDAYHVQASADTRLALRKCIMTELETAGVLAVRELENIVKAKRFDREYFDGDTGFADWAQSRARHTLRACEVVALNGADNASPTNR